jgi:hypothetical protein
MITSTKSGISKRPTLVSDQRKLINCQANKQVNYVLKMQVHNEVASPSHRILVGISQAVWWQTYEDTK